MSHRTYTLDQIKQANKDAGLHGVIPAHWFEPASMRFFGSRVHATTYGPDSVGKVYFVSSEYTGFEREQRAYTVRVFEPANGSVSNASDFNEFSTRAAAHRAAANLARS